MDKGAEKIAQGLGFENLPLGLLTIFMPTWIVPAAIAVVLQPRRPRSPSTRHPSVMAGLVPAIHGL
ncbi:MAG TPA: hypothetical protein VII91_08560 [Bauldia sp.]